MYIVPGNCCMYCLQVGFARTVMDRTSHSLCTLCKLLLSHALPLSESPPPHTHTDTDYIYKFNTWTYQWDQRPLVSHTSHITIHSLLLPLSIFPFLLPISLFLLPPSLQAPLSLLLFNVICSVGETAAGLFFVVSTVPLENIIMW